MTSEADRSTTAGQPVPPARPSPDVTPPPETHPAPGKPRPWMMRYLGTFSPAGLTGALICYCLSLTPSLLPRVWYLQAGMSGLTTVIGYGLGVFTGWLARSLIPWRPGSRVKRAAWWALAVAAVVLIPLFGVLGAEWQHDIRELTGGGQPSEARYILVVIVALLVAAALLAAGRGLRWLTRLVARPLHPFIPRPAATAAGVLVVCVVLGLLVTGVLSRVALNVANTVFGDLDNSTAPGVAKPASALRSGSPESLVSWLTLGRQGRTFEAGGPTPAEISAFSGKPAMEPVRVYVGLKSADSIAAEAALAVRELDRTGAFDRQVLAVVTTTGTGWINPAMIDPLEYMYDGDTAAAAIQYSYLPSWISFIADKAIAQEAGRDLFDDVYARWLARPADHRPKLVVYGESLGSFGGEGAFSGAEDIRDRTSGVLWVGPTNSNALWQRFVAGRDRGTPEWLPVYQNGQTVRFANSPADLNQPSPAWAQPRVGYLQNASDPIVWWSWQLAFHRPGWLTGRRGPDVISAMHWYPVVTFWQVTADLALSTAVPPGHGHSYGMLDGASAWASIIPPPGWTAERTEALAGRLAN
jgi:uncharacterized membrane protein